MTRLSGLEPCTPGGALAWPAPEPARLGLSNATTVDRRLAHKRSAEQVFITGVARDGGTLVALGALPRMHRFFNDCAAPGYDALLVAEFVRQGIEVIAHALLAVPLTRQLVLRMVELELTRPPAEVTAAEAVVVLRDEQFRRNRAGEVYAVSGPACLLLDGRPAAVSGGALTFMDQGAYAALREGASRTGPRVPGTRLPALKPQAVGRQLGDNVLITPPEGPPAQARCLVLPRPHPAFFDRQLDHYPGMLIAEASRQLATASLAARAAAAASSLRVGYAALDFVSFAELDQPLTLQVTTWIELDAGAELTVAACQGARRTSTCRFRLSRDAGEGTS